jgi:hypothetical protein
MVLLGALTHNEVTPVDGGWRVLFASVASVAPAAEFLRSA